MLKAFLKKYSISPNDPLIIACSGGPDSMYLLCETAKVHPKEHIVVAHFNHGIRGTESDGDETFVRDFCESRGFVFESIKKDIPGIAHETKKGIEETARIERYAFLESVREQYGAKYILTAHHLDDSIETLLFNLIRGTKISGLTGIPERNGHILRPLLRTPKTEILEKLEQENIPYRLDSTNADDAYLRNHLRLNVVSGFERINPEYRKNMASFMAYMSELGEFIDQQASIFLRGESSFEPSPPAPLLRRRGEKVLTPSPLRQGSGRGTDGELNNPVSTSTSFQVSGFQALPSFLQREVIRYLYKEANNGTVGLSEGGIAEIIRFIGDKGNHTRKQLGKLHLEKRNMRVYFESR